MRKELELDRETLTNAVGRRRLSVSLPFCWTLLLCSICLLFGGQEGGGQEETSANGLPQASAGVRQVEKEPRSWNGPDGKPLPFKSLDEILGFLRTGKVIERKKIGVGTTGTVRLLLEQDGARMRAIFRDVKVFKREMRLADGTTHLNFRDDATFECAAFELNRLLGLYVVPPTVERNIKGVNGTVQAWVEGTMMEKERMEKEIQPADQWRWLMQRQVMQVFDSLIYNEDRNVGNILITNDWLLVLIDHTRSFRNHEKLLNPDSLRYCERNLLENLKSLNQEQLTERLGKYLTGTQIRAVLKRRDLLVEHFEKLIAEHGSSDVLFSFYK